MQTPHYFLLGSLWILASVSLGLYIRGKGLKGKQHYMIGFKTMIITYLVGVGTLFAVLVLA